MAYNLTAAVREPLEMATKHLLDSLPVLPHLYGNDLLDVGTGAGLPGILLAVAAPKRTFLSARQQL
jgi:16S rRNA (guanine527-N7)-methyltransferase